MLEILLCAVLLIYIQKTGRNTNINFISGGKNE